ncbi:MAG: helix-turn-helix transcriptional regulator [Devosia sp.]
MGETDIQLLPASEVRRLAPISTVTRWRWVKEGLFPKPIKLAGRNYWRHDEIQAWLAKQSAARAA